MMTKLSGCGLIFAMLAVLASWNSRSSPDGDSTEVIDGAGPCCQRHRTTGPDIPMANPLEDGKSEGHATT